VIIKIDASIKIMMLKITKINRFFPPRRTSEWREKANR